MKQQIKRVVYKWVDILKSPPPTISPTRYYNAMLEKRLIEDFLRDDAIWCNDEFSIKKICLDAITVDGLVLEFGVFQGRSINYIAENTPRKVHGFDSFEGLPEGKGVWKRYVTDRIFDLKGVLPKVKENVELHKGWFDETLPRFLASHPEKVAFCHIDSDIYSSAKTILNLLANRMVRGTIILFDEYFNYEGWQFEEYRAFHEFTQRHGVKYRYLAVDTNTELLHPYGKVAVIVDEIASTPSVPSLARQSNQ